MTSLCTSTNFFGGKYDLIKLHRQIINQNDEKLLETITITTTIFYLRNKNDMAAHAICFYFCFCQQPSRIGQNSCRARADKKGTSKTDW